MEPSVLSIYRGQARTGIGEGPNVPVSHGEQYLHGTTESFRDGDLLQAVRPWASLDSDPGDHQRLKDRLEAWSCFTLGFRGNDWLFVARLVSAGIYDRRAAYFSHARAFRMKDFPGPLDPGVYLGCSKVFDEPDREGNSQAQLDSLPPSAVPASWLGPLSAEADAARRFLGHLLQALEGGYPLIVAAPVREFTPGSALFALAAFARAALPLDLKQRCGLRLYTRQPQRFLRQLGASLVMLPDDSAGDALAAQRDATLLDRSGQVKAGRRLDPRAEAYADVVLAGVLQEPRGFLPFSAHLRSGGLGGRPLGEDRRLLQLVYNLAGALAMATGERDFDYLFRQLLRAQARSGADLPWAELLRPEEWSKFPSATLGEFVLEPAEGLASGERALQDAVLRLIRDRPALLDDPFRRWWNGDDPAKRARLLELLNAAASLFSPEVVGTRTAEVPLAGWIGHGPLHGLLETESRAGVLERRAGEGARLAELATDPETLRILLAAVETGRLPPDWISEFAATAGGPALLGAVREILGKPRDWDRWGRLTERLLDGLRAGPPLPGDLLRVVAEVGASLDFRTHWSLYLRLADLLARADPGASAHPPGTLLMQRLWRDLATLDRPEQRAQLVDIALDPGWPALGPEWLVAPDGRPALPWGPAVAERLLASEAVTAQLDTAALLDLLERAEPPPSAEAIRRAYRAITAKWRSDAAGTTARLVLARAWLGWRRAAEDQLAAGEKRAAALSWLRCPAWREAGADQPQPTLEAFDQVAADLAPLGISGREMASLVRTEGRRGALWPWIRDFENSQTAAFARLAGDLGALAELAETIALEFDLTPDSGLKTVFGCSRYAKSPHSWEIPRWLLDPKPADAPVTRLADSQWLLDHAGHRRGHAMAARIRSVLAQLDPLRPESLDAADRPELWPEPEFAEGLADWLCHGWDFSPDFLKSLDRRIDLQRLPRLPSTGDRKRYAKAVADKGYRNIAGLLDPERHHNLAARALAALRGDRADDPVWAEIRDWQEMPRLDDNGRRHPGSSGHPLSELARKNWRSRELSAPRHWQYFMNAARNCPDLLRHVTHPEIGLPAFELAASLYGDRPRAAWMFARGVQGVCPETQASPAWWRGLIRSLSAMTGLESGPVDAALNRIVHFANADLGPRERGALAQALRAENKEGYVRELRMQSFPQGI